MNPATGTFISMDTYQGTIFDPTSLHKYLYANANPVTYCDPSGYSSYAAEQNAAMIIMGNLSEMVSTAASVAWNFYLKFKASMPMLVASATGMAAFLSNSPVFMDICARFASGDLTVPELCNQIIETFNIIDQSIWDHIYEATNRGHSSSSSGSSSGGNSASGNIPPNDPNFWEKVNEAISKVSNRYKGLGKCDQFKDAFTRELDKRGINYEIIKVESNYPKAGIFSDKYRGIIGETGYHYGVRVGDVVYDNLTTEGMNFFEWINDLGGSQYIHWH